MKRTANKIQLPIDFAKQLLECQIQYKLSTPPDQNTIKSLIYWYSLGFEYYQSINNHKYLYFQNKMKQIFDVLANSTTNSNQQLNQNKLANTSQKYQQNNAFKKNADHSIESIVLMKQMMNDIKIRSIESELLVKKQLQRQEAKLKQKIRNRRLRVASIKQLSTTEGNKTQKILLPQNSISADVHENEVTQFSINQCVQNFKEEKDDDRIYPIQRTKSQLIIPTKKI